ncbi:MAG: acetylxylan esterase [Dysgonamonadaceae bacterium]|jgi:cephalosporin-C deacetylase-like acetyl esterase|nr:acetylxylan esterase [Dysgonamonadaceae bacterium]
MKNTNFFALFLLLILCISTSCKKTEGEFNVQFSSEWKILTGVEPDSAWNQLQFDDSDWVVIDNDKSFAEQGFKLVHHKGYYRKTIELPDSVIEEAQKFGGAKLHLGAFFNADKTWFNGVLIGETGILGEEYGGYMKWARDYFLPDSLLKSGENLIAIAFDGGWTGAGLVTGSRLAVSVGEISNIDCFITADDSDYVFLSPQNATISARVVNRNQHTVNETFTIIIKSDAVIGNKTVFQDAQTFSVEGGKETTATLSWNDPQPGVYQVLTSIKHHNRVIFDKKFNIVYEPEKIISPADGQPDLKEFWQKSLAELAAVQPDYQLVEQPELSNENYTVYIVNMRSYGNEPICGYYAKPTREGKFPAIVQYMGYNAQPTPPDTAWNGYATFILSVRGQGLNDSMLVKGESTKNTWFSKGVGDKETYYYHGAFLDAVRAIDFVCSREEIDTERIVVSGGSQGGTLTLAAAALDKRVKAAAPIIPFSDFPDFFKPIIWPRIELVAYRWKHWGTTWKDLYKTLSYFDVKNLAEWIECPVLMSFGVQDPLCTPHVNFAVYNNIKSPKSWVANAEYGHSTAKTFYQDADMFFAKQLAEE